MAPRKKARKAKVKKIKKIRKAKKVVKKRKVLRRKVKKAVQRIKRKTVRSKVKTAKKTKASKKAALKVLGKVVHYYDRLGVGIVELKAPVAVGTAVTFRRGDEEFSQTLSSMQIDHTPVAKAKKGDVIGVKVEKEVKDGALVLLG